MVKCINALGGWPLPERGVAGLWGLAVERGVCGGWGEFIEALEELGGDLFPGGWGKGMREGKGEGMGWREVGEVCWRAGAGREERRRAGSFYTPDVIIDRILDWLWGDIVSGVGPVCDPAMGCGFFILRLIERLRGAGMEEGEVRKWVGERVYGVDKEAGAVLLARALMWVVLSGKGNVFWPDRGKLRCGDALLGPGFGENGVGVGMDWGMAFPDVLAGGGFGVVMGNPPWEVLTNFGRNPEAREYAGRLRGCGWYGESLRGQINLYRCFVERGLGLLRKGGGLSFVAPLSLARDGVAEGVRRRLVWEEGAGEWWLYGEEEGLFKGVTQSVCVFGARKGAGVAEGVKVYSAKGGVVLEVGELEGFGGGVAAIPEVGEEELALWRWIEGNVEGEFGDVVEMMRVGEVDQTVFRECMRDTDTGCILARGAHLRPFVLDVEGSEGRERFLDRERFLEMKGWGERMEKERVGRGRVAQLGIRNMRTRPRLVAGVAPEGVYLGNSLNVFYPGRGVSLLFVCGVLNSRLLDWMFCLGSGNNNINLREVGRLAFPGEFREVMAGGVAEAAARCEAVAREGGDLTRWRKELDGRVEELFGVPDELVRAVFG